MMKKQADIETAVHQAKSRIKARECFHAATLDVNLQEKGSVNHEHWHNDMIDSIIVKTLEWVLKT